jgi:hypothetical protein
MQRRTNVMVRARMKAPTPEARDTSVLHTSQLEASRVGIVPSGDTTNSAGSGRFGDLRLTSAISILSHDLSARLRRLVRRSQACRTIRSAKNAFHYPAVANRGRR